MTSLLEEPVDQSDRGRIEHETASTLFVEAGAGSGKTHSLVSRICRLVLDEGVELDRIAAITFTEKAAAELRERLRARISGAEDCERRNVALGQVDTAAIGTLHSFAARIVSEHPLSIGVPPRIRVVDEMGSRLAFERRWQRIRSRLFPPAGESSDVAAAMKVIIAAGASLDQLRGLADRLDRHWDRLAVPDRPLPLRTPGLDPILQQVDSLLDCLDDCTDRSDKFAERLTLVRAWRDQLAARSEDDAWLKSAGNCPTVGNGGAGKNWVGGAARVKELKQQLKDLAAESERVCTEYRAAALDIVVSRIVLSEARNRKHSGELEFHDLLVYARDIARHGEEQAALHTRYQRILLDEFQDTDPLQLELAEAIVEGASGRLFTVGDPKQSIYRFRRADIATYMAARDAHEGRNETAIVRLTTNFRSSRPVLDWVNAVFAHLMVAEHHTQAGYTPLDPAPGRPQWDSSWGPEPFAFCSPVELEDSGLSPANALRSAETQDVARVIATALDQKWYKEVGGPDRMFEHVPLNLSEVCILIPARLVPGTGQTAETCVTIWRGRRRSRRTTPV
ncbi:UvrD-helicase domain-containing protein [Prescottella equi]|uniref:UvrD-helicase domain-containing protein n=1 Tax=Rhodococcus hoagii TaxID=43767 RepID=UPI003D95DB04